MSAHPSPHVPVVVVGASAGGVEALRDFAGALPADLDAAVLVVLHVPSSAHSALPAILDRAGPLPAKHAVEGEPLHPGRILVAPPDHHLVVLDGHVSLTHGPQENGHRPAVDVLFRSAARAAGPGVAAVVLSGSLDDGAAGAVTVTQRGGRLFVQDFDEALYDGMPRAAEAAAGGAARAPVTKIPTLVVDWLMTGPVPSTDPPGARLDTEVEMAEVRPQALHEPERPGEPAGFGCPECAGALFQIREGRLTRFRCRVGHAWSPESLLARQTIATESALWMALRALEEKAALNGELALRGDQQGHRHAAETFRANAADASNAAELVRRLIADLGRSTAPGQH
jgi:two-component system chemotaxis response regulator CheB